MSSTARHSARGPHSGGTRTRWIVTSACLVVAVLVAVVLLVMPHGNSAPHAPMTGAAAGNVAAAGAPQMVGTSHLATVPASTTAQHKRQHHPVRTHLTVNPFAKYTGTWYSSETGVTLTMANNGHVTLSWAKNTVYAVFKASGNKLTGTVTYADVPSGSGFHVGGTMTLQFCSTTLVLKSSMADPAKFTRR